MEFKELQKEIIEKAKAADACQEGIQAAKNAQNEEELLQVILNYLGWLSENKILSTEYFAKFDQDALKKSGIMGPGKENTGWANSGDRNSGDRNSGDSNSGNWNSGNRNSGNMNSGDSNSGDSNSGDSNSGDRNSGDSNSGNWNSGDWNSGNRNSGDSNSGNWNSGNWNSGNWNSGNRNSGDSNSGYRNSGAFCLDNNPRMILFDKPCKKMTVREWEQSKAYELMHQINPTVWVQWDAMSEAEQKANPKYEAAEGYTKSIPLKEAWANAWGNWSAENRKVFTDLENFDAEKFKSITGIDINA